jgi:predicted DNA-binding transcriptional regulator YafY
MLETSVRLLRLLSLLQQRREWTGADLARRLEVTTRTVRTDVGKLRQLGYQVDSTTGPAGGYRLGSGTAMPPLLLDDDEAVAVVVGLRAAAAGTVTGIEDVSLRALTKLERTLPARLRPRVDALRSATVSAAGVGPTVDASTLTAVAAAAHSHERLRFSYSGHDGTVSVRDVEPHTLVYTGRRWYLLAWDTDRRDWRTFRADRITPLPPTVASPGGTSAAAGPRFVPREPPGGDAAAHVLRGVVSAPWPFKVRVILRAPASVVAERTTPTSGRVTDLGDGTCELVTGYDSLADLTTYLSGFDVPFTVLEPPELRAFLRERANRYLDASS